MGKTVAAYWCMSQNFGDVLTPWLLEKMTGNFPLYCSNRDFQHYIMVGSILNWANCNSLVWGAGIATITDGIDPLTSIHAVRGPLSRARVLSFGRKCPEVFGDPALLLPRFYTPKNPYGRRWYIGVVPHYVDQPRAYWWYHEQTDNIKLINVLQPIEKVIDDICACDVIYSSSLHGMVVADAYNIPNCWGLMSDSVGGDGTKFRDYCMGIGRHVDDPFDWRKDHPATPSRSIPLVSKSFDAEAFLKTFPQMG